MGITDIRLSGSYPRTYYAIYGRSLVVHIVSKGIQVANTFLKIISSIPLERNNNLKK